MDNICDMDPGSEAGMTPEIRCSKLAGHPGRRLVGDPDISKKGLNGDLGFTHKN
jgi:hypothetical protein